MGITPRHAKRRRINTAAPTKHTRCYFSLDVAIDTYSVVRRPRTPLQECRPVWGAGEVPKAYRKALTPIRVTHVHTAMRNLGNLKPTSNGEDAVQQNAKTFQTSCISRPYRTHRPCEGAPIRYPPHVAQYTFCDILMIFKKHHSKYMDSWYLLPRLSLFLKELWQLLCVPT